MTPAEFLALPDRGKDAVVAGQIFGVKWVKGTVTAFGLPNEKLEWEFPHYSTSIAAAWEVVEKFTSRGWEFSLNFDTERLPLFDEKDYWLASVWDRYTNDKSELAQKAKNTSALSHGHKHAPLAICLAALKAVGFLHDP